MSLDHNTSRKRKHPRNRRLNLKLKQKPAREGANLTSPHCKSVFAASATYLNNCVRPRRKRHYMYSVYLHYIARIPLLPPPLSHGASLWCSGSLLQYLLQLHRETVSETLTPLYTTHSLLPSGAQVSTHYSSLQLYTTSAEAHHTSLVVR